MEKADYQLLLEHGTDIHWMLDCVTGQLLYVSPVAARRFGWSPEQVLERAQAIAAPLLHDLPERLARFRQGDGTRHTVLREAELEGIAVEIESTLVDERRLVGVARDISARRAFEHQQKQFASMLSHEFRSPLATIDGAIQRLVMTDKGADEGTTKRYHKIQAAVDRLLGMVDEYLSPERLAAIGRRQRENGIEPAALLEAAAAHARVRRPGIVVHGGDAPAWVRADPEGMRMCLDVLLDNAIKYTPPGSPIELWAGKADGGGIEFTVADRGPPIPEGEIGRLFDKGYRGIAAVGIAGSGIGLYMAKAVIEVHGGTLSVQNLPESGKKFRIWLPVAV
ncbi:PAS domain-containing sensor histidine kinase [Pseudoduganella sp. SL102]|uniref:PAS domain-containing sensor histidine kinase n=1 Tax=Pseudoduganella sp. SL102 TaxID=2995154 RepID=UPI00248C1FDF|nr:PAS domain-containing sensor histidine kinase [Pseudoduganella sp. SL102]WBS02886.1 PAS domain-containing sensor histidine kinase [Pseudoduganella sp. SL102]